MQPALGPGLERDRGLVLIALPPVSAVDGAIVRDFVRELHEVTERCAPDEEISAILDGIPDQVSMIVLAPS